MTTAAAALARYSGVPAEELDRWRTEGLRYHGHVERLEAFTIDALHELIQRCPDHLAIIGQVDPRVWRRAVCEEALGDPSVPEEAA